MIEQPQRLIVPPDRETAAPCDRYETLQRFFYLKKTKRRTSMARDGLMRGHEEKEKVIKIQREEEEM